MTVRDTIGQLLMVGFQGTELSPEFIEWLQEYRPGGVILFSRNLVDAEQVARLTNSLQEHAPNPPLLIAIDQEGGRVSRLPQGFTIFPSAASVAACQSPDVAYGVAEITAKELRAVGINMNMAPVLDVNSNPANPIIGNRAYGDCPEQVCTFGIATMQGLQDHGVIPCGKHFPGHGDTTTDSHKVLPVVTADRARLTAIEFEPFRQAIQQGLPTLMTAHVYYPALDAEAPATLSRTILTDLLRNELGFQGITLTDDMEMRAILDHGSIGEASVRSLQAGADIVLICHQQSRQTEAIQAIEQALDRGELSMDHLKASVDRITALKHTRLSTFQPVDPTLITHTVGIPEHKSFLEKIQRVAARV
ncbi:beta-N-acetylhexosaminidase [Candidatus Nitronereus thalassa]|uniref:Beta-N-acetylhexosaminidase n=1 Tax=Candidatus Nitronereus thalassa TaxID=3020898 RepID=A0ABU3K8F3_9BACT|nr:beta-N-acetylhexosaminidase [Candidatus Nitronereus thalassa]MDT7042593.1 beta-N-acetylhexosaminidase [Candidatus Nitronereus thalassa]